MKFYKRLFHPPKQSFFLFGPRGTGKTTLIHRLYPDALWIDLLKPNLLRTYSARPERLYELVAAHPEKNEIVIDEVQKVPSLLSVVHSLIEEKKGKQFVLTGSSSRKLRQVGADLLAGRALKCTLHPFMGAEVSDHFSLEHALKYGLLPQAFEGAHVHAFLETYVGLYLQEEIQTEGLVRNLESFSRFLETISFSHATQLNVTNIARECEVKRKTVENYISILEDLLLAYRLPVFQG
jgi:predicted AAA+ superfamily ATPase